MLRLVADTRLPPEEILPASGVEAKERNGKQWNERDEQGGFRWGITRAQVEVMRDQWLKEWSWSKTKETINRHQNYIATVEGVDVHFQHATSKRPDAIPLLVVHGWPSSFYEFHRLIPLLTDPQESDAAAFHVVAVSQVGFFLSGKPPAVQWSMKDNARIYNKIMMHLGYDSYVAHGGDWGSQAVCGLNGVPACKAIHVNMLPADKNGGGMTQLLWMIGNFVPMVKTRLVPRLLSEEDRRALDRTKWWFTSGGGYFLLQATKPSKIGMALSDSPLGLLAYIGEIWLEISASELSGQKAHFDDLISTVALYHLSQSFSTSVLPYAQLDFSAKQELNKQPIGHSVFRNEVVFAPHSWNKASFSALLWHRRHDVGGHFPALDCTEVLAKDLSDFTLAHYA